MWIKFRILNKKFYLYVLIRFTVYKSIIDNNELLIFLIVNEFIDVLLYSNTVYLQVMRNQFFNLLLRL